MKKVHTDPDAEVITLANRPGQIREWNRQVRSARKFEMEQRRGAFRKARGKFFKTVAGLEGCILGVLTSVAAIMGGWCSGWLAVLLAAFFAAGAGVLGAQCKRGQWYVLN